MNLFRRPSVRYARTPEPETPYLKAAQVWDERIGSARVQAKNWRLMAFGSLALAGGFATALVWQSTQGTVVPWVVQVDRLGPAQTVAAATADYRAADRGAARSTTIRLRFGRIRRGAPHEWPLLLGEVDGRAASSRRP